MQAHLSATNTVRRVIDAQRFGRLIHAYGFAADPPGHLAALADGDDDARTAALNHLWSAVIHQGTPWTVTPDAAFVVAALIGDPRLAGPESAALRADLLTSSPPWPRNPAPRGARRLGRRR